MKREMKFYTRALNLLLFTTALVFASTAVLIAQTEPEIIEYIEQDNNSLLLPDSVELDSIYRQDGKIVDIVEESEVALEEVEQFDCALVNNTYMPGESLDYKIAYNWGALWLNAGEVNFSVTEAVMQDKQTYHLRGTGRSISSFDWFFKVRDVYESWIDQSTLLPVRYKRDVSEGGYTINNQYTFDHENLAADIDYMETQGNLKRANEVIPIQSCTQDILSAIYYTRNLDFENAQVNDTLNFNILLDGELYDIWVRYTGKEEVKTRRAKYNCIGFSPLLIEGTIFESGDEMKVFVTDDANKIPVLIESKIAVGSIKAYLDSASGLRHPQTARI